MLLYSKIVQLICFTVFIYYFLQLYSMYYLNQTDLQLLFSNQRSFPNFVLCFLYIVPNIFSKNTSLAHLESMIDVRMSLTQSSNSSHLSKPFTTGWVKQVETSDPTFEGEVSYCAVFVVPDWPGDARLVLTPKRVYVVGILFFTNHESESVTNPWHYFYPENLGKVTEIVRSSESRLNARLKTSCWTWPVIKQMYQKCTISMTKDNAIELEYVHNFSSPLCIQDALQNVCDYQQFHVARQFPKRFLRDETTKLTTEIEDNQHGIQIQSPLLEVNQFPLLDLSKFFWYALQLLSSFFGLTFFNELRQLTEAKYHFKKFFHSNSATVWAIFRKLVYTVPAILFYIHLKPLAEQFFFENVCNRHLIRLVVAQVPDYTLSVCSKLETIYNESIMKNCFVLVEMNSNVADQVINYSSTIIREHAVQILECAVGLKNVRQGYYLRNNYLCVRFLVKSMGRILNLIENQLYFQALSPFAVKSENPVPIEIDYFKIYMHPANELAHSEKELTLPQVLQNKVLIKDRMLGPQCQDYTALNFTSQNDCIAQCILKVYTHKYRAIPSYISFAPLQHPQWAEWPFSDLFDKHIEKRCSQQCHLQDCYQIIFRPNYYPNNYKKSILIPKQTWKIRMKEEPKIHWDEFLLQVLSLTNFCFGITPFRLVRRFLLKFKRNLDYPKVRRSLIFAALSIAVIFVCIVYHSQANQSLLISTHFIQLSRIRPPSLYICLKHNQWQNNTSLDTFLSSMNLTFVLPNQTYVNYNPYELSPLINRTMNTSPIGRCLQFDLNFMMEFQDFEMKQMSLYDLFLARQPPFWSYIGSHLTPTPIFFLTEPALYTFIHIRVVYDGPHLCKRYPLPRAQFALQYLNKLIIKLKRKEINEQQMLINFRRHQKVTYKPDCEYDQYMPVLIFETDPAKQEQRITIINSNFQIKVVFSDSFSVSRFLILFITIMELFLNITFNQSLTNVLRFGWKKWMSRKKVFFRNKSRFTIVTNR